MSDQDAKGAHNAPRVISANTDLIGGIIVGLFGLVGLLAATEGNFNVWVFPRFNSVVIVLMAIGLIIKGIVRPGSEVLVERRALYIRVLPFAAGLIAFYFLFTRIGFLTAAILLFGLGTFSLRKRHTARTFVTSFLIAIIMTLIIYQVLKGVFYVPFPTGEWWEALSGG